MIPKLYAHDERTLSVVLDEGALLRPADIAAFRTDAALGHTPDADETVFEPVAVPPLAA